MIEIKEFFDICNIWRVRNRRYTRLSFDKIILKAIFKEELTFLISKILQESISKTDIIFPHSSDHSPTLLTLKLDKKSQKGKGLWKFNNFLLPDEEFVLKIKDHIAMSIENLSKENVFDD